MSAATDAIEDDATDNTVSAAGERTPGMGWKRWYSGMVGESCGDCVGAAEVDMTD